MKSVGFWIVVVLTFASWAYVIYVAVRHRSLRKMLITPKRYGDYSDRERQLIREFHREPIPNNAIVAFEDGYLTVHHFHSAK